jgi:hypothetical protein
MRFQITRFLRSLITNVFLHLITAVCSFLICAVPLVLFFEYQIRNEPSENLRYVGIVFWFIVCCPLGSTLLVSFPACLLLQWLENKHSAKWWKKPFLITSLLLFSYLFADKEVLPGLPVLVLIAANFVIYWVVFHYMKHRFVWANKNV